MPAPDSPFGNTLDASPKVPTRCLRAAGGRWRHQRCGARRVADGGFQILQESGRRDRPREVPVQRAAAEGTCDHFSQNPTIAALYTDSEVLAAVPFYGDLYDVFTHTIARPSRIAGTRYAQLSSAFETAVHDALSSGGGAAQKLATLQKTLERLSRNGRW